MRINVTFSFDDGCLYDFKTINILQKYNLKATFFVANHHNNVPLDSSKIKELSEYSEIGAHTRNHLDLRTLNYEEQFQEIDYNKKYLEDILGKKINVFCAPFGYYDANSIKIAKELEFTGFRTTLDMNIKRNGFLIKTTLQLYPHNPKILLYHLIKNNLKMFLGNPFLISRLNFFELFLFFYSYLRQKEEYTTDTLHLWGHSWEIENIKYWFTFEKIIKLICEDEFYPIYNSEVKSS